MNEKIYILLPVHNRREITYRFIECLKGQTHQNYHLVLIDDGCTDNTEEMVSSHIDKLTIIKGKGDWWWAGSLQQGYLWLKSQKLTTSDFVLIINNDTEFEAGFLEIGVTLLGNQERTLLLAQCYNRETNRLIDAGVHVNWFPLTFKHLISPEQINCLSTRGLFLRFSDFLNIGGFYPRILPHYLSDYEFTIRAKYKGMKLITSPLLRLWVDEDATGYHKFVDESFIDFLKKFFSHKSAANPVYWTVFVALACPWRWKFLSFLWVWAVASYKIFNAFLKSINVL